MAQEKTAAPAPRAAATDGPAAGPPRERAGAGATRRVLAGRIAGAVAGGLLLFLSFPPLGLWFLAPLGLALTVLSVYGSRPRRALWLGLLTGLAFLLPALHWVSPIGVDAWLGLVALESLFYAAWAAGTALAVRLPLWPLWSAALWVAMEWARGQFPFGGFPWARVAFSQGESVFTPYAALGGAPLVTFAVALCGGLIALLALRLAAAPRWDRAIALPLAGALAVPAAAFAVPRFGDEGRTVTIGVIQGNVPGRGMNPLGNEPAVVLRNHTRMLHEMAQAVREGRTPRPDLVVLPENSTDIDPYRSDFARGEIDAAVKDIGVPVLVGAVVGIGENNRATRSLVWDPVTGPGAYYDKQQLVPFGEYTPLKELVLALFERAGLVGKQSVSGTRDGDLKVGPVTVGAINCYEVAFDGIVGDTARTGASPLVVQTNNATYALTNLPAQQLAMSQLRAVEHNRAVVTSAITGISAYVTPDGTIAWRTGELVPAANVLRVPVRTAETVATRVGALPEWALILVSVGALAVAWRRGPRNLVHSANQEGDRQVGDE
ncbi:apolipoprotein N-acyltransferase [Streptosporangium roseum]|uniref:Apolipoprotein N-acyltransferase n=1 Tax=Streptosporangium roseum (strain ATCC 12428 / DSM 43021 / JCM 3005 / KCTC 9067 / NCIMB 10171 / NRRL 2505 / NI 9100) TaxID=479432 RepID=D2ASN9_STRRD|nr:apolipoprotein N-acyltransferase [Streptosporangium roseum]ACZ88562.1 Apolipoprotein N-acyltransferase-like protein [Streptosporangium roseum DSM 43021]